MFQPLRASRPLVLLASMTAAAVGADDPAPRPPPPPPPTAPTRRTVTDAQIATAIRELGDGDFRARERASRTLWSAGAAAEPALRKALDEADPETARRLRTVLSNLAYGVTPDMSDEVIELMSRYRGGDANVKRQAVEALGNSGAAGARVLFRLRRDEPDPDVRTAIAALLLRDSRALAVTLIADDDPDTAGRLLAVAALTPDSDEDAARDYAAFLLVHGGLRERIAAFTARVDRGDTGAGGAVRDGAGAAVGGAGGDDDAAVAAATADAARAGAGANAAGAARAGAADQADARNGNAPGVAADVPSAARAAFVLAFLHRAAGDAAAARAAGERAGDELLAWNLLVEQGDWPELARRAAAAQDAGRADGDTQALSFAAAFHRLAGDEAGVDRFAKLLAAAADRAPDDGWHAAEGLLLNGRAEQGIDVLARHRQLAAAVEFHTQRLSLGEVPRLLERARAGNVPDLGTIEAKAARAAWFAGDLAAAAAALAAAQSSAEQRRDLPGLVQAVGVATEMGLAGRARAYTVDAMMAAQRAAQPPAAQPPDDLVKLFEQARFRDAARAAGWWQVVRARFPREPAAITLDKLRAIDERRTPAGDLQATCDASAADAVKRRPPDVRDAQLELIADTLAAFGRRPQAAERYRQLVNVGAASSPERVAGALSKLAAFDADAGRWREAADLYEQSWSRDHGNAVPLFLAGWCLKKAGDAAAGDARMARARLLPLGDEDQRYALYEAMAERQLKAEATRERDAILRTAAFLSWRRSEALRRAGDEAHAVGDALRAADLWERAFLDNNSQQTRFVEPWANVSMPALVRRTRAVGLIRAGKYAEGLKEADAAMALSPGDADALIEVVAALDAARQKAYADGFYAKSAARYAALCAKHPQSGPLHNLAAWAAAKCRRDLDGALAHAKRAVELHPTHTASLDTLAETHFQRSEYDAAIAAMQKCAELEPNDPHHKEQLARFRKAKAARQPATTRASTTRPTR